MDAVVAGVGDVEMRCKYAKRADILWRRELAVAGAVRSVLVSKGAVGMKTLDAVVAGVGDVNPKRDVVVLDAARRRELAVAGAVRAELEDKGAVGVEDLDAVVAGVGDGDPKGGGHGPPRRSLATRTGRRRSRTSRTRGKGCRWGRRPGCGGCRCRRQRPLRHDYKRRRRQETRTARRRSRRHSRRRSVCTGRWHRPPPRPARVSLTQWRRRRRQATGSAEGGGRRRTCRRRPRACL